MTTTPFMLTVEIMARIASTAAPSALFFSPRPTQRPPAIAAASVDPHQLESEVAVGLAVLHRVLRRLRALSRVGRQPSGAAGGGLDARPAAGDDGAMTVTGQLRAPARSPCVASRYSMGSMPNMLRSLLVIGFFLLVLVAIVPRMSEVERPAVDAAGKASTVAAQTGWPIELPTGLGSGWVPTTATYAPGTDKVPTFTTVWKTPAGGDLAFKQAAAPTDGWVSTLGHRRPARPAPSPSAGAPSSGMPVGARRRSATSCARPPPTRPHPRRDEERREDELKAFVAALAEVTPAS